MYPYIYVFHFPATSTRAAPRGFKLKALVPRRRAPVGAPGCRLAGGTQGLGARQSHCWGVRSSVQLQPPLAGQTEAACCVSGSPGWRLVAVGVSSAPRCGLQMSSVQLQS